MINKCLSYLESKKDKINQFLPIFLAIYMALLILPYVWGRVDVMNNFFSHGLSQLLFRFFTMMFALVYLGLVGLSNKVKINLYYLIGGGILILCFIVSWIISPYTIYQEDGSVLIVTKWWWYLFDLVKFSLAIILFIFVSHFVHVAMNDKKTLNISFYVLIGVTLFACLFSFIFESKDLVNLFNGADVHSVDLSSIFQNKNSYGMFLFLASIATSYIIFTNDNNVRYTFFLIPLLVFTIMSILVGSRTAFLACILLLAYLFIRSLFLLKSISKKAFYFLIIIACILLSAILLFFLVPVFHSGPFSSFYNIMIYMFNQISESFTGRVDIWNGIPKFMTGGYLVFGANFTNSQYLLHLYSGYYDAHSGYLTWFIRTGIIGSIVYVTLFSHIIYLLAKLCKKNLMQAILIIIFLLSSMVFIFTETAILFISTSLFTFVINLVVVVYLKYLLKKE